jgi:hypothetical protein
LFPASLERVPRSRQRCGPGTPAAGTEVQYFGSAVIPNETETIPARLVVIEAGRNIEFFSFDKALTEFSRDDICEFLLANSLRWAACKKVSEKCGDPININAPSL